ncbi:dihydrodipicolinate synthase family protein [Kocuria sp. HSID16901]|uniref:dihydrodipicolinate synthase family protein n=1 Tax=Kocuria sp. HSID16901 TaxID=2419505 RepID=UPI0006614E64|nr:dihydrodipicolinate synthase family protein [Kocuria sp. HSID16901]RUQ20447.1 dihydrodipicolinate synthase family protein [Kocuria sp. HSID16901]
MEPDSSELFTGLSAFPLTPLHDDRMDESAFGNIIGMLDAASVDSITVLGSTGSYAYLHTEERARAVELAVENASSTPVFAGIGALRTSDVLTHAANAREAGARALLLAPVSYQPLTDEDVFHLYRAVSESTDLPIIVYDNPTTTHFSFSLDLYARVAALPHVASVKIPPLPSDSRAAAERVHQIRDVIPRDVVVGISGDASAAQGLVAGCSVWYSVIGGVLPQLALPIVEAARQGHDALARETSDRLRPLWDLYTEFGGSARVAAAIAEALGLAQPSCLPRPILGLDESGRRRVVAALREVGIDRTVDGSAFGDHR